MYHVSAQGVDGRMMNVYYYYMLCSAFRAEVLRHLKSPFVARLRCVQTALLFFCQYTRVCGCLCV